MECLLPGSGPFVTSRQDPGGERVADQAVRSTPEGLPCGQPPPGYKASRDGRARARKEPSVSREELGDPVAFRRRTSARAETRLRLVVETGFEVFRRGLRRRRPLNGARARRESLLATMAKGAAGVEEGSQRGSAQRQRTDLERSRPALARAATTSG